MADALEGTFVSMKTMADGQVRIVLDMDCTLSEFAQMKPSPGIPFAVARMVTDSEKVSQSSQVVEGKGRAPRTRFTGSLCDYAVMWCKQPEFWKFLEVNGETQAKDRILALCDCFESRKELDTNPECGRLFREKVMGPWSIYSDNPHKIC